MTPPEHASHLAGLASRDRQRRLFRNIPRSDVWLWLLAALSAAIYLLGMPRVHPDRLATLYLTDAEAIDAASGFLRDIGVDPSDLRPDVERRRNVALIARLQEVRGRSALMHARPADLQESTPVHFYSVAFLPANEDETTAVYSVDLTGSGHTWQLDRPVSPDSEGRPLRVVDRDALAAGLSALDYRFPSGEDIDSWADSTLASRFAFARRMSGPPETEPGRPPVESRSNRSGDTDAQRRLLILGAESAVAIARYHLDRHGLRGWRLASDSVWTTPGDPYARIRFVSDRAAVDVANVTQITVAPTGALHEISVDLVQEDSENPTRLGVVAAVLAGSLFLILGILLLVGFFQRLLARAVDVKAALLDGVIFGILFVVFVLTSSGMLVDDGPIWIRLAAIAGIVFVGGTAASLGVFLISGAADSLARRGWAAKLRTTSLLRQGTILNGFVGAAVLRGLAIGLLLLAATTLFMLVFSDAAVSFEDRTLGERSIRPFVTAIAGSGLLAYLVSVVVVLAVAAVLYAPRRTRWVPTLGVVLALTLSLAAPVSFDVAPYTWGASAIAGVIIAFAFMRYDLLTVFSALSSSSLIWLVQEGWIMPGSPYWIDLLMAGIFFLLVLSVCFVGLSRGRELPGVDEYVPSYIRELRQQERLQRELEIAHQVQESFLPHEMPRVDHLDIAAVCVAAEVVGGDYYDLVPLDDDRLAIAVGDVSGKGIQAAFFMTLTKGFLRSLCREHEAPVEVLRRMNRLFVENAPRGVFISLVYGVMNVRTGRFTFARAGHNPLILRRADGQSRHIVPAGIGIGLDQGPGFDRYIKESTVILQRGDALVFYTDGFSEARTKDGEELGGDRLLACVAKADGSSASELLNSVHRDVDGFVRGADRHDDMTMLVVRYTGQGGSA